MAKWADANARGKISWTKRPQSLATEIDTLKREWATNITLARVLARLYWNLPLASRSLPTASSDHDIERYAAAANQIANQLGFNLLRDLVDGMAARVCRQMACKVVTVGGDSTLRMQSAKMSRLIDGLNGENKTREVGEQLFIDACTTRGFAAAKVYFDPASNELKLMRLDPFGIFFRRSGGANPSQMFTQSSVPREYLQDTYPKKADAIAKLPTERRPIIVGVEESGASAEDTVLVNEGWKLGRGDKPGKWTMTAGQIVLEDDEYPYDFHQVVMFRVFPEFTGAGGVSLARLGAPYHRWLNQLVRIAHDSFQGNVPRIVRNAQTTVNEGGFGTTPFAETIYEGQEAPTIIPGNVVSEQVLNFMPQIRHMAHVDTGVNEAMSSGVKPTGINSGTALREFKDFADARLNGPNERWAQLWADIGKAFIGIGAENFKNQSIVVRAAGSKMLQEIKWKDVDLRKNKYRLEFAVTSGLSQTVAGKMQDVEDLQDRGLSDNIQSLLMLKDTVPDIAAYADRITAPRRLAERMVEDALDGNYRPPSGMMGPDFLRDIQLIGSQMYAKAELDGDHTPEELECLRKLLKAAQRKSAPPLPPIVPVQSAPAMSPNAVRGAGFQGPPQPPAAIPSQA